MEALLKYRGREVVPEDVAFINKLIQQNPEASRRALSLKLCEAWEWVQQNGAPRDMVCRGLLLALARAGHIALPEPRVVFRQPWIRNRPAAPEAIDQTPIGGELSELGELSFHQVRRTEKERLFSGLIQAHHYLGYTQPVGEHLKFMVYAGQRPVACFAWGSAPRHLRPRDQFIGWSRTARQKNIHLLAYNSRFLILPWVKVPHLASHLLGRMARMLPAEWQRVYGHPVYFLETFVYTEKYRGTCYRAANWVFLGRTTGRGNNDRLNRPNRPIKDMLGYPLVKDFRQRLGREA
jgi:hypothetical protein